MERRFLLGFLCLALVLGLWPLALQTAQAQDGDVMTSEPQEPSGGSGNVASINRGRSSWPT